MSDWYSQPEREPRGLFGFLGGPETGESVGDSLGLISQILMNLGSGRGGAGLTEAMNNFDERRIQRRDRRQMARMANRMADKIEQTNPDLAALIRSNHKLGLELAGKLALQPIEFQQEKELAEMRGDINSKAAIDLANRKAVLKQEYIQGILDRAGVGGAPVSSSTTADDSIPAEDIIPNDPDAISLGTGEDEVQVSPISKKSVVPAPGVEGGAEQPVQTAPEIPQEYLVGLPADKRMADTVLRQRLMHQDPEISASDVSSYVMSLSDEDQSGRQKYFDNIAKRKEVQARVREFATGANEMARQNQALPGINLQTPGQPELMQARIPLESVPVNEQPQAAEYLKQAVREGDYKDALKSFLPKGSGGEVILPDGTVIKTGGKVDKPSEYQQKNDEFYLRGTQSTPILESAPVLKALTGKKNPAIASILPAWAANNWTSNEYKNGVIAARNFVAVLLRKDSGAQVSDEEMALYWDIFIPTSGEGPQQEALKKSLRDSALLGIKNNRSPEEVLMEAYANKKKAELGLTGEGEAPLEVSPEVSERLKKYPPKPAAGP